MHRIAAMITGICCCFLLCGFNGSIRPVTVDGRRYVNLEDAAKAKGWKLIYAPEGNSVAVSGGRFSLKLVHNSAAATLARVRLALAEKVFRQPDGSWIVSDEDFRHTLQPVLFPDLLLSSPVRRVVIDAGHGGTDPGAVRCGVLEKSLNMRLVNFLVPKLEAMGLKVVLTRSGDTAVSLDARADRVRTENGDIFLSIHQNASANPKATGVEIFFAPGTRYAAQSMLLGHAILYSVLGSADGYGTAMDRGIKRAGFRVIRKADCPAVLLECGFLSNDIDREKLMQDDYLQKMADCIAGGIDCYMMWRRQAGKEASQKEEEGNDEH